MKVVILAGGLGTRLAEETKSIPKPMVEIGGKPILWHIMSHYAAFGFDEFVIALGYKADAIKRYFLDFAAMNGDCEIDLATGAVRVEETAPVSWRVSLVDTGTNTQTGGRVRRLRTRIGDSPFLLTYGDGVADVDLRDLVRFHRREGRMATVTAVRPPSRFGSLGLDEGRVLRFKEKPQAAEGWINGGFFVFEPSVLELIDGDETPLEAAPMERLVARGELSAYRHSGFWHMMDTPRDRELLETYWSTGRAPWRTEALCAHFGVAA